MLEPEDDKPAERQNIPLLAKLEISMGALTRDFVLVRTVNLSESGALVRSGRTVPVGSEVTFQLLVEEDSVPIRGTALVIRQADAAKEQTYGIALQFTEFEEDDAARLREFLEAVARYREQQAAAGSE